MVEEKTSTTTLRIMNGILFQELFRSMEARRMASEILNAITKLPKDVLLQADYTKPGINLSGNEKIRGEIRITVDRYCRFIIQINGEYYKALQQPFDSFCALDLFEEKQEEEEYSKIIVVSIDEENFYQTDQALLTFQLKDQEGHMENDFIKTYHVVLPNIHQENDSMPAILYPFKKFLESTTLEELQENSRFIPFFQKACEKVEEILKNENFQEKYQQIESVENEKKEMEKAVLLKVAKRLQNQNFKEETIFKVTGLTKEEIERSSL